MAIYHFSVKVIGRSAGRSVVAAAAYRAGERLVDERRGRTRDYRSKADVIHTEILLPEGAPASLADRTTLWNAVEARERRRDAELARDIEIALPRELGLAGAVALARDFVDQAFVSQGMIADLCIHAPRDAQGELQPHAHVLLTTREVLPEGFGLKVRDWRHKGELVRWREDWADFANQRLAEHGHDIRIDHRSLAKQGLPLEPQNKIGPVARWLEQSERAKAHRAIARRNGERLADDPSIALTAITHQQSTFTRADLARFIHRHSDGAEQFAALMAKVEALPELVRLGRDSRGDERFTTSEMIGVETRLVQAGAQLAAQRAHDLKTPHLPDVLLSDAQRAALGEVLRPDGLSLVVGVAGSGKSAMLRSARKAWERQGYHVRGLTLSAIAAQGLQQSSGIESRTIASLEHAWGRGFEGLSPRDVLVIDEAGLVGSRPMARVLGEAARAGAKVVAVGDVQQLQAIEAGAPFRALVEQHGAAELVDVWRQRAGWQREATAELAGGQTGAALRRYLDAGAIKAHDRIADAQAALVKRWAATRGKATTASPEGSTSVMLAATRDGVAALNGLAREHRRRAGELGDDVSVATSRGERALAVGDTIMFGRNDRELGVRNGTLGRIDYVDARGLQAMVEGRPVAVAFAHYAHVDHGYAMTVHKAQGITVDHAFVLASPTMDRHSTYVALSRHREGVELHYARDDFASSQQLVRRLSRERLNDLALDYQRAFADQRGIEPKPKAGIFDGLRLRVGPTTPAHVETHRSVDPPELAKARYRAAMRDAARMHKLGLPVLAHQAKALKAVRRELGLDTTGPRSSRAARLHERDERDRDFGFER